MRLQKYIYLVALGFQVDKAALPVVHSENRNVMVEALTLRHVNPKKSGRDTIHIATRLRGAALVEAGKANEAARGFGRFAQDRIGQRDRK